MNEIVNGLKEFAYSIGAYVGCFILTLGLVGAVELIVNLFQ